MANELQIKEQARLRGSILALESLMLGMKEHHVDLPIKHHYAPGIYMREMFIPKGTTLTGLIHKTEHYCILSQGHVKVWTEQGMLELKASTVVHSLPGAKRVLYAFEDTTWINVHHNPLNVQEDEKMEALYTVTTFEDLALFNEARKELK